MVPKATMNNATKNATGPAPPRCDGFFRAFELISQGGPTSHTAILARARGIVAVVSAAEAENLTDGIQAKIPLPQAIWNEFWLSYCEISSYKYFSYYI